MGARVTFAMPGEHEDILNKYQELHADLPHVQHDTDSWTLPAIGTPPVVASRDRKAWTLPTGGRHGNDEEDGSKQQQAENLDDNGNIVPPAATPTLTSLDPSMLLSDELQALTLVAAGNMRQSLDSFNGNDNAVGSVEDMTTSGQLLSSLSSENLKMSLANSDGLSDKEDTVQHMKQHVAHRSQGSLSDSDSCASDNEEWTYTRVAVGQEA